MVGEGGEFIKCGSGVQHCGFTSECSAPFADDEAATRVIDDIAIVNEDTAATRYIFQPEDITIFATV